MEVVTKDPKGLLTPENLEIYYNGLQLPHVKSLQFNVDAEQPLATITLTLLANVVVRTELNS